MFAKTIIDSDAFLDMPLSSQALYFHLSMRADDDGFINNPKKIQRVIGASEDDLKVLLAKNFLIPFENGIVVVKHWRIHNYIQNDRYKKTVYLEELDQLEIKENKAYTRKNGMDTRCIHDAYTLEAQVSIGKDSIDKDSIGKSEYTPAPDESSTNRGTNRTPKNPKHKYGEYQNVLLTDEEYQKLTDEYGEDKRDKCIEKLSGYLASKGDKYKSHYATIRNWVKDAVNEHKGTNKVADQLEESYKMIAEWGKNHED